MAGWLLALAGAVLALFPHLFGGGDVASFAATGLFDLLDGITLALGPQWLVGWIETGLPTPVIRLAGVAMLIAGCALGCEGESRDRA
ncbi:MAG: hypothetical protein KDJ80_01840 [Nitratireductor sp.]|nr:hypothetical protein [Nitratireductor sp.]